MDYTAFPPITALLHLIGGAIDGLAALVAPLAGPSAAAVAVILLTLCVRTALIPAALAQARGEQARARLAPAVAEIQRRWKGKPERLQRELADLYAAERTSPLAGCLPMLVQAPIVALVYTLFGHTMIAGEPNELLAHELGGISLGDSFAGLAAAGALEPSVFVVYGVIVALLVAAGEATRRVFRPVAPAAPTAGTPGAPGAPSARLLGMLGFLQFATAVVALFVPLAAALYLTTTVLWTFGQRLVLRRLVPPPATAVERGPEIAPA
ncbi:YidC/Oxa1 family membrane protein insertase [Agromyces seonyuensis]|uniref:Membrane protein insertase YidC n=1 Tax=Agromyces seonyuensis TaxID=2662446 RepID=A0A6I4P0Y5_9MICO|nr:membrane protein insertase YidC [Agromyces seonyuensis]MWC00207.1 membrane protein insertase YidC [Agromyces seonyuensis]